MLAYLAPPLEKKTKMLLDDHQKSVIDTVDVDLKNEIRNQNLMLGGAETFGKMTLNIRTLTRMTLSIPTFSIIALITMRISINKTFSITTLGTMTPNVLSQP